MVVRRNLNHRVTLHKNYLFFFNYKKIKLFDYGTIFLRLTSASNAPVKHLKF